MILEPWLPCQCDHSEIVCVSTPSFFARICTCPLSEKKSTDVSVSIDVEFISGSLGG